ncbi:MAG: FG-GAP-like repeat-containing protein [Candidatus Edwardsbacteria bacterium]
MGASSVAIGNLDGDDKLEVIFGTSDAGSGRLYVLNSDGTLRWQKPVGASILSSPAIGDIDGDGKPEIVFGLSCSPSVVGFHSDGGTVGGFPLKMGDGTRSSPVITDLDKDGDVEIIIGCLDNKVHCWDLSGEYNSRRMEWATFHHDERRTGCYHTNRPLLSYSPNATAYNNGQKLVRVPNTDDLWLVYESGEKVFVTSSLDGGVNWNLPMCLGYGYLPSIALDSQNKPCIAWTRYTGHICYTRLASIWQPPWLLPVCSASEPSLAIDPATDMGYLLFIEHYWWPQPEEGDLACARFPVDNFNAAVVDTVCSINSIFGPPARSPSITLDLTTTPSMPYAAWKNGGNDIYYKYRVSTVGWDDPLYPIPLYTSSDLVSQKPMIDFYGSEFVALWEEEQEPGSGIYDVWERRASGGSWQPARNFSQTLEDSRSPVISGSQYYTWRENPTRTNPEIYFYSPFTETLNVSQTSENSKYPHLAWRRVITGPGLRSRTYVYFVWTEGNSAPYEVKTKTISFSDYPSPYVAANVGLPAPSPYTISRDTFFVFGSEPYQKVDVGYDTLKYRITGLNPELRYPLELVSYHESKGKWKQSVEIDGKKHKMIHFEAGKPETTLIWIPPAFYKDREIVLKVTKEKGEYAALASIKVYEFDREEKSEGATQLTAEVQNPSSAIQTKLYQNAPNPFNSATVIRYEVSENNKHISLKIYNIAGQLVKTLVDGNVEAGIHTSAWDGKDSEGKRVASGVYFYRLTTGDFADIKKLILLK